MFLTMKDIWQGIVMHMQWSRLHHCTAEFHHLHHHQKGGWSHLLSKPLNIFDIQSHLRMISHFK